MNKIYFVSLGILLFLFTYLIFILPGQVRSIECESIYSYPGKTTIVSSNGDTFFISEYYQCIDSIGFDDYKAHIIAFLTGRNIMEEKQKAYQVSFSQ